MKYTNAKPPETQRDREERLAVEDQKTEAPVRRTSAGLRDALFDEIDKFRRGSGDSSRASAISKLASNIILAAKLELEFKKAGFPEKERMAPVPLGIEDKT